MSSKSKSLTKDRLTLILATLSILLVSVAGVMAVRAYLLAKSNEKINEFSPMTYTDTEIQEVTGDEYQLSATSTIDKDAVVHNPEGVQKKPVYVRVAVVCKVYDEAGINVSYKYNCQASFTIDDTTWQSIDGFYYYKSALLPGASTTNLFNSDVTISNTTDIPSNYTIKLDVISDTVQAVETDSSKWTKDDLDPVLANDAWGVTGTIDSTDASREKISWS